VGFVEVKLHHLLGAALKFVLCCRLHVVTFRVYFSEMAQSVWPDKLTIARLNDCEE